MKQYFILYTEELGEEFRSNDLIKVYKEWRRLVADDKEHHEKIKTYWFELVEIYDDEPGVEYHTEIKIYRRGNKVFWRAI